MIPSQEKSECEFRAYCPFCNSITLTGRQDPKFYISWPDGLYYCHHCQAKGKRSSDEDWDDLQMVDSISKKIFEPQSLDKLLSKHLILEDFIADRFPLPASTTSERDNTTSAARSGLILDRVKYNNDIKAIAIPTYNFDGEIVGIKYRKIDPEANPRYISEPGSVNEGYWININRDNFPIQNKLLIIEGELDALTAHLCGFKGTILATQTNRINENQLKRINSFSDVFLLPDNDLGGLELENSANELLGAFKVKVIKLNDPDCKDLNEMLQRRGYDECREFIRIQTRTQMERDTRCLNESIPELLTFLSDERNTRGDSTGWNSIDDLLGGGLRAGEMSVINAFAKAGKSSFINNLIHNLAKSGKKVALASFEMPPHSIYTTLISIASQINIRELSESDRNELITESCNDFKYLENIVILKQFGYTPWEDIERWAIYCKLQYAIDYLVLDHVGFMVEKMTDAEDNQILAKNIKKLTNTLGIHIPVVVQAPKTKDGLSIQTSYGGMAWAMNADNFITLERSKDNEMELKVKLEAARYPGANPSSSPSLLFYDKSSCTLTE